MKLIEDPRAPNPRRVRIFLSEKQIEVASEPREIMALEHKTDQVGEANPTGYLPILILDDGTAISETIAICRYFEALHPDPPLMGTGALQCALVEMWQRRVEFHYFLPVVYSVRHLHPSFAKLESPQVADWGNANTARVDEAFKMLDQQLAENEFIAGEHFTVADITAVAATEFARVARIAIPDTVPNFTRWWQAASARPSVVG